MSAVADLLGDGDLPDGFHKVSLLVTTKELGIIRTEAIFSGEGTYSSGLRKLLGWYETPYGLKAALKRRNKEQESK